MSGEETPSELKTAGDYDDVKKLAAELKCEYRNASDIELIQLAYQIKIAGLLQEVATNTTP